MSSEPVKDAHIYKFVGTLIGTLEPRKWKIVRLGDGFMETVNAYLFTIEPVTLFARRRDNKAHVWSMTTVLPVLSYGLPVHAHTHGENSAARVAGSNEPVDASANLCAPGAFGVVGGGKLGPSVASAEIQLAAPAVTRGPEVKAGIQVTVASFRIWLVAIVYLVAIVVSSKGLKYDMGCFHANAALYAIGERGITATHYGGAEVQERDRNEPAADGFLAVVVAASRVAQRRCFSRF